MYTSTRLDQIAERNSRSRIVDVAFAAMVALLMVLCLASLRAATAETMSIAPAAHEVTPAQVAVESTGATCELNTAC